MFKVNVSSVAIHTRNGISPRTGKPYSMREQTGWIYLVDQEGKPNPHPTQITLLLDDQQAPYAIGDYMVKPSSFYVARFGKLSVNIELEPVRQPVKAAA